jgi:hypothetical protein
MIEVVRPAKMPVNFYQIMCHHRNTEDITLHSSEFAAVVGSCENSNEPSYAVKGKEFLQFLFFFLLLHFVHQLLLQKLENNVLETGYVSVLK